MAGARGGVLLARHKALIDTSFDEIVRTVQSHVVALVGAARFPTPVMKRNGGGRTRSGRGEDRLKDLGVVVDNFGGERSPHAGSAHLPQPPVS
jgi:hypothetical protein